MLTELAKRFLFRRRDDLPCGSQAHNDGNDLFGTNVTYMYAAFRDRARFDGHVYCTTAIAIRRSRL
jgi:hypothetical protein